MRERERDIERVYKRKKETERRKRQREGRDRGKEETLIK